MNPALLDEYLELTERLQEADRALQIAPDTASAKTLLPHQQPPPPPWHGWVLTGGRGGGKTLAGTHWLAGIAASTPGLRARIITPTLSDAVNGAVLDPDSGILAASPSATFHPSGPEGVRVTWPNGSTAWCVGTPTLKDADRLRALTNVDVDLFDEAAANPQLTYAFQQASLSRRGKRLAHPLWAATTTPRPMPQIRAWLADPDVVVTRATTFDNPHTPDTYRDYAQSLKGTRAYRQEVLGEVLDTIEGALWSLPDIERSLTAPPPPDELDRVVIGVDPPSGSGTCGIVVAAKHAQTQHIHILADYSITNVTPSGWAEQVARAHAAYPSALVVAEVNQGGRMVTEVLASTAPQIPVTAVSASVGKQTRAEPVAVLWEASEQRGHFSPPIEDPGALGDLADQLTAWVPDSGQASPDRLDAMVWACAYLLTRTIARATMHDPTRRPLALAGPRPSTFRSALQGG